MSRFGDGDGDEDFPGQWGLWQGNLDRSWKGRKGTRMLQATRAALLTMPDKRLVHGVLCDGEMVCAVGAVIVERRVLAGEDRATVMSALAKEYGGCADCGHSKPEHNAMVIHTRAVPYVGHGGWWRRNGAALPANLTRWREFYETRFVCLTCREKSDRATALEGARFRIDCDEFRTEGTEWDTANAAAANGLPRLAAYQIEYHNDETISERVSPEQRYVEVLRWVERELRTRGVAA